MIGFLLLGATGITMEVFYTAIVARAWRSGRGYSYAWMFPVYGAAYPAIMIAQPLIADFPLLIRGVVYALMFILGEWMSGWALRVLLGEAPWEAGYREHRTIGQGLVRPDLAPMWFLVGILFERLALVCP